MWFPDINSNCSKVGVCTYALDGQVEARPEWRYGHVNRHSTCFASVNACRGL